MPDGEPSRRQPQPGEAHAPCPGRPSICRPARRVRADLGAPPPARWHMGAGPPGDKAPPAPSLPGPGPNQLTPDNAEEPPDQDLEGPAWQGLEAAGAPVQGGHVSSRCPGELGGAEWVRAAGALSPLPLPHPGPCEHGASRGTFQRRTGPQPTVTNVSSKLVSARCWPVWDEAAPAGRGAWLSHTKCPVLPSRPGPTSRPPRPSPRSPPTCSGSSDPGSLSI